MSFARISIFIKYMTYQWYLFNRMPINSSLSWFLSCWRIPIESKKIFEIQWFRGNHVKMLCSINNTICIPYLSTISIFITSNSSNKTFNKPHKHFVVYSISCGLRWAIHITLLLHSHTLQWGRLLFAPNFPFLFLRRLVISLFL